ncbi:TPA: hypothetical protein ACX3FR_004161 [Vibrio parahaemolyticus]
MSVQSVDEDINFFVDNLCEGDFDMATTLIDDFFTSMTDDVGKLRKCAVSQFSLKPEYVRRMLHKLVGASGLLRLLCIEEKLRGFESQVDENKLPQPFFYLELETVIEHYQNLYYQSLNHLHEQKVKC